MAWSKRKAHTRKPRKSWQATIKVKATTVRKTYKKKRKRK